MSDDVFSSLKEAEDLFRKLKKEILGESVGLEIVFWSKINNYRFSGKVLACDGIYVKYFDDHKLKEKLFKIADMEDVQLA